MTVRAVTLAEQLGVIGDVVFVVVVLYGGLHGLLRQDRAVDLVGGQTVQGLHHRLIGQLQRFAHRLTLDHLGGDGAGGDGGAAAKGGQHSQVHRDACE